MTLTKKSEFSVAMFIVFSPVISFAQQPASTYALSQKPHTGPVLSAESLKVLDDYFKWRRSPEGQSWAK